MTSILSIRIRAGAFERAAKSMWRDHPMGVGANQYVVVANSEGYSARAGVIWNWASRSANVHNMYLLAAAETGWPGFLTFIALLLIPTIRGLVFAFRNRCGPRGEIVLGAACCSPSRCGLRRAVYLRRGTRFVCGPLA